MALDDLTAREPVPAPTCMRITLSRVGFRQWVAACEPLDIEADGEHPMAALHNFGLRIQFGLHSTAAREGA